MKFIFTSLLGQAHLSSDSSIKNNKLKKKNLELELESRAQDIMSMADEDVDTWWHLNQLKTIGTYEPPYNIGLLDCLLTSLKVSHLHKKMESLRRENTRLPHIDIIVSLFFSLSL